MTSMNILIIVCLLAVAATASGGESPVGHEDFCPSPEQPIGWRGDGNGCFPGAKPVMEWHEQGEDDPKAPKLQPGETPDSAPNKNIVWKTPMPGVSSSSPIVVKGKVFTLADPYWLICLDAATGKVLWQREVLFTDSLPAEKARQARTLYDEAWKALLKTSKNATGMSASLYTVNPGDGNRENATAEEFAQAKQLWERLKSEYRLHLPYWLYNGFSTPTPTSDGESLFVKFNQGTVARYDLDGKRRWMTAIPLDEWIHDEAASSPVLVEDKLVVTFVPKGGGKRTKLQALTAFDKMTGRTIWVSESFRNTGNGSGSPAALRVGGVSCIITAGGAIVRASDGKVLARDVAAAGNGNSPSVVGDTAYFQGDEVPEGNPVHIIRCSMPSPGNLAWQELSHNMRLKQNRFFASPLAYEGRIYCQASGAFVEVRSAKDGALLSRIDHPRWDTWSYPSPSVANNHLYLFSWYHGIVLTLGDTPKPIRTNTLQDKMGACPFFVGNRIYLRTLNYVYCIGSQP